MEDMHPLRTCLAALVILLFALPALAPRAAAASVRVAVAHGTILPGQRQTVVVQGVVQGQYDLTVKLPDGEILAAPAGKGSSSGAVRWSFIQPPGTITHAGRLATVRFTAGGHSYTAQYSIAFDPLDVVVPHSPVAENSETTIWIHARPRARVEVQISRGGAITHRNVMTGRGGWASIHLREENDSPPFGPITVSVVATTVVGGTVQAARADFQVLPFQFGVSLQDLQIQHQVAGTWVETSRVLPGEDIRVEGQPYITEPAGNTPQCVSGYVAVVQAGDAMQMAPLKCVTEETREMIAMFQLSKDLVAGPAEVDVDVFFQNGTAHLVLPFAITPNGGPGNDLHG